MFYGEPRTKATKCRFNWIGPQRITEILEDLVFEVSSLLGQNSVIFHAARIMPYRAIMDNTDVSQKLLEQAEHSEAKFEMIASCWIFEKQKTEFLPRFSWSDYRTNLTGPGNKCQNCTRMYHKSWTNS